jgi:hypothetical protein
MNTQNDLQEGYYSGTVTSAWLEQNDEEEEDLILVCNVEVDNGLGEVETRRSLMRGDPDRLARSIEIAASLGVERWPEDLERLSDRAPGKKVRLWVKHNVSRNGRLFVNAYLILGGRRARKASQEAVRRIINGYKQPPF